MNKSSNYKSHLALKIITIIFAVYSFFNIIGLRSSIKAKQNELDTVEQQIYEQQVENQRLSESMNKELTDDDIAEIAMEKLGYAFPGEVIFKNITGK